MTKAVAMSKKDNGPTGVSRVVIAVVCDDRLVRLAVQVGLSPTEVREAAALLDETHCLTIIHKLVEGLRKVRACNRSRASLSALSAKNDIGIPNR